MEGESKSGPKGESNGTSPDWQQDLKDYFADKKDLKPMTSGLRSNTCGSRASAELGEPGMPTPEESAKAAYRKLTTHWSTATHG